MCRLNGNAVSGRYFKIGISNDEKPNYTLKKFKYYADGHGRDSYIVYN
jgi:hypothetical protein